jgi:superfamily II DNA or RNA helicase
MQLRPYQLAALDRLDGLQQFCNVQAPLLVAPTGSGKTVIAAEIIRRSGDSRTLFLAPRRELIHQTCRKLNEIGVNHGVLLAGDGRTNLYVNVQVASRDTLIARLLRRKRYELAPFDRIIIDEAHVGLTDRTQQLLALWPQAYIIGLTATPTRSDGKALGRVYDELIEVSTTQELTDQGFLCPARYFSVSEPDLRKVRTTAGDYNRGDLEEVMNRSKLVGDIVEHWLTHAASRRTVVFATTIPHSVALAQQFLTQGVAAEHVDANTPQAAREAIFERFSTGRTQVLTNCTLASIGFDLPALDCVVFARPTKSVGLYLQMLGRGLRPAPGKADCLVLDHAGNVHRHGFATDPRFWTLHGKYAIDEQRTKEAQRKKQEEGIVQLTCPSCKSVFAGSNQCPECGYYFARKARAVLAREGSLVEITSTRDGRGVLAQSRDERRLFFLQLVGYGEMRGYKGGWAGWKYKERYGHWPERAWRDHVSRYGGIDPNIDTMRWVKAQQMAYRRVKAREYHPNTEATRLWMESSHDE